MDKSKEIQKVLNEMGISITSKFIPWSIAKSHPYNKDSKFPSLNWEVTLFKNGQKILTGEYHEGQGHCPANKNAKAKYELQKMIEKECEEGFEAWYGNALDFVHVNKKKPILPDMVSFVWCTLSDANSGRDDFHDFCGNFGYDEDSRSAERIWKACVETAAKIYSSFTTEELNILEELYQDY